MEWCYLSGLFGGFEGLGSVQDERELIELNMKMKIRRIMDVCN